MRRYLRLLAALVLITVVFTAALVGCSSLKNAYNNGDPIGYGNGNNAANNNGVGNNETEDVQTSEPIVTDDIVDVDVSIFANGKTDFSIVISNLASEVVSSAANNIKAAFSSKLGTSIELNNEHYFKLAHGGLLKGPKIVVGTLSEDIISAAIEKPLRDGEYVLKVTDGSLYIIGGTEAATVQAVNYFINVFIKNESTPIYLRAGLIYEKKTSAPIINMAVAGNEIWKYGIVHDDTAFARLCAERIRAAIASASGYTLPMSTDASGESAYEILVGKTNRSASVDVNDKYSRPNVYYDIKTVGKKLVIMGEGYITLDKVASEFEKYVSSAGGFGSSFVGSVKSGNIISLVDAGAGESMFTRAADTDLRVMHWNMSDAELGAASPIYTDERMRGEIMADAILQMYPDVVTANELYDRENGEFYDAVVGELGEHYHILKSEYEVGKPEGADAIEGKGINSNIFYKKDAKMTVVSSGWRYSSEKTAATEDNPNGWVYYNGYHTAVFKSYYGDKFIVSVAHNADSRASTKWVEEHIAAVEDARSSVENGAALPVILTGDMYTYANRSPEANGAGYYFLMGQGYSDAQVSALINANAPDGCIDLDNTKHGTVHDVGVMQLQGASEDLIWLNSGFSALKFKVLTFKEVQNSSDHYPIVVDIKFN